MKRESRKKEWTESRRMPYLAPVGERTGTRSHPSTVFGKGKDMKRIIALFVMAVAVLAVSSAMAAETSVKGTIFTTWMLNKTDGQDNYNAFSVDRAYLGAESKLSDYTSIRITFDIRPERFSTKKQTIVDSDDDTVTVPAMSAYDGNPVILKYAYADWKIKPVAQYLKIRFGLQPTIYLNYMDGIWSRRYIERNIGDLYGWTSTADLGLSALFTLGPQGNLGEAGLSVFNGTKYSDVTDKNKNKDVNLFAKISPFYNNGDFHLVTFFGQFYTGTQNKEITGSTEASDWRKQIVSAGAKLAYQKTVDLCLDANVQTLGQGAGKSDLKQRGLSFWGNLYLNSLVSDTSPLKTLVLFGRVDAYDPNTDLDKDGNTMVIAGVECAPVKGVKASLNYRHTGFQDDEAASLKYVSLNTEFKF